LQLDLCLNSFYNRCVDSSYLNIKVIYTYDELHKQSYKILQAEHPSVEFIKENNFKQDLLNSINEYYHILFCVDDTIFTQDFILKNKVVYALNNLPPALGFSLRLGTNTKYCYPLDKYQEIPHSFSTNKSGILFYSWNNAQYDFAYPLEVSSSVYRTQDIYPILSGGDYSNPNQLEALLDYNSMVFREIRPFMLYYHQSVAFSNPVNKIQTVAPLNRVGNNKLYESDILLEKYINGYRIDPDKFYGFVSNGCHILVDLFNKENNYK